MVSRRDFLRTATLASSALVFNLRRAAGQATEVQYFGLNDFIETHPDAVFFLRTTVDAKTNAAAIKEVGYRLGKTLLVGKTSPTNAYPVTANVALKPNMTSWAWDKPPVDQVMGIQTDPNFVEGLINSLTDLTVPAGNIFIREANYSSQNADGKWYANLAQRSGINLKQCPSLPSLPPTDVQWVDVADGKWFSRIPYLWPVNAPGTCLLNIAKFKSHSMGMTLCSKNLQGANASPYVSHCKAWGTTMSGVDSSHIVPGAFSSIKAAYDIHKANIPRWKLLDGDTGAGSAGGLWMETHTARCLDNNSVLQPLLNIVEGVYGREGPFVSGPQDNNGYGRDVMSNIVLFGKNARHVDLVGTYLAGHEPGNFGLFHIARERGLSKFLNPREVPLYEWKLDGTASGVSLQQLPRTPIRTLYLRQAGEDSYHMVDQPFDYAATAVKREEPARAQPDVFALSQNFPNPFNPTTSIQYFLPRGGHVRLEITDVRGEVVDILVDRAMAPGDHLEMWNSARRASGTYFYRLSFEGVSRTRSMVLIR